MSDVADPVAEFLRAASVPREDEGERSHVSGTLERAEAIVAAHPEVALASVHTAAVLGDDDGVRAFLASEPASATEPGGPYDWDALTYLCFSRYLRLDRTRSDGFLRAARALLDGGADPNTGFFERSHQPQPEWESAIYGAAGVAHDAALTRLLLERGADPNDGETPYHAPETYDNAALSELLGSGRLIPDSLATMLLRKADWHDYEGLRLLLEHGADPNHRGRWPQTTLVHALRRDNTLRNIELLLDHGADPSLRDRREGESAVEVAALRGRGDVLELFARRGLAPALHGVAALSAACAAGDEAAVRSIAQVAPDVVVELRAQGGERLAQFAGNGNEEGVRLLLELGVPVDALYEQGDGYFEVPPRSTALHVAAWRARPDTVRVLIERGAPLDARDGVGRTPLQVAVGALVHSWWAGSVSPGAVATLLAAGASPEGIAYPSGSAAVDDVLRQHAVGQ